MSSVPYPTFELKAQLITLSRDTTIVSQLKTAATGIESAQAGVNTILQALFSGQAAPANSRQQVGDGINAAAAALNSALANSCVFLGFWWIYVLIDY